MAQKAEVLILNEKKWRKDKEAIVVICTTCPECGKEHLLGMTTEDFQSDALVSDTFSDEPSEIRELLITGTCSECWDKLFPKDE